MDISFYTSPMSEEIRDEARAENQAKNILRLLELHRVAVADEVRERVSACRDLQLLDQWFSRAVTASTIDEVFGEKQ